MTTMFVQLRRVVYLLVLLQCCACVAYAQSGDRASMTADEKNIEQGMTELRAKMEEEKKKVEDVLESVNTVKKEWSEVSKRVQNATTTAKEVGKLLMETKGRVLRQTENENKNMSELKEVLGKAVDASKEITDAVDNASLTAKKISNLTQEIQQGEEDLAKVIRHLTWTADKHINNEDETSLSEEKKKVKQLAEQCMKKVENVWTFLQRVNEVTTSTHSLVEKAEKQVATASVAAADLQKIINETYRACPEIKADLEREIEEANQRITETDTANEGKEPPHNNEELDDSLPNKQNEKETKDQNTNSTEAETEAMQMPNSSRINRTLRTKMKKAMLKHKRIIIVLRATFLHPVIHLLLDPRHHNHKVRRLILLQLQTI
ncbi:uncharacterized protein TM35_000122740 [Trypanosoma theileri]|uniref:Uncharacterized protein n=1 Tax=Trypanosoma theileri TaxID=67003 RepID=A0A1X0NZ66_9TRYP|nr:uncharacterized protein TM35_000122740 [Trypanosoma theileri]ORC89499.1 hypothetical protein TM35_000122740 [Trypanosoma theileri]